MNVAWSDDALNRLQEIEQTISRRSPMYARSLARRIIQRCDRLVFFPRSSPIVLEYRGREIRELLESSDRIFYRVGEDEVEIMAIIHATRRRPPTIAR